MSEQYFGAAYGANPAENYERFFVPAIGAPVADRLVRLAAIQPGERVLDVACGTGVVARQAARKVGEAGSVTAVDINPAMLAVGRSAADPALEIDWHESSAESMPLPDAAFDVVLCQMGLQFMPDKLAALREMRRVVADDGRLLLNAPGPAASIFTALAQALDRHIGAEAGAAMRHVFSLDDTAELEDLMRAAGFTDARADEEIRELTLPTSKAFLWQYVTSTPLAAAVMAADESARAALERAVLAEWEPHEKAGALVCEQRIVVGQAKAA